MRRPNAIVLFFVVLLLGLYSCYPTKNVPKGKFLLIKNKYEITHGKIKRHNIPSYFIQKPNKQVLGVRFYLRAYDFGTLFPDSSFLNRIFKNNVGEEPVIYDSATLVQSGIKIKRHLNNLGYYNAKVFAKITSRAFFKTARINYIIDAGKPYHIRNIDFNIQDKSLRNFVLADMGNSLVKSGDLFDVNQLKKERNRIADNLNNAGYYYFITNQITYSADTNLMSHQVDLILNIKPLQARKRLLDSVVYIQDKKFLFRNIYVLYDLGKSDLGSRGTDTLAYQYKGQKNRIYTYHFIYKHKMDMNPKAIVNALFIKPGQYYKKHDIIESYKALTSINAFRYINIETVDIQNNTAKGYLDCYVQVLRSLKYAFNSDSEVKNTGGDFGLEQSIGFSSRNTLRNAELFRLNISGAMEKQSKTNVSQTSKWPFNVYEAGINLSMELPRFLNPFRPDQTSRYLRPKTSISLGNNYQKRPDYERYITNGSFSYQWKPLDKRIHKFKLLEVSAVNINPTADFQKVIDTYTDPRILYSYQDHIVLSSGYSYNYNEHKFKGLKPFKYLYSRIEVGGLPWNYMVKTKSGDTTGQRYVFGLPSSQFVLVENDFRYYMPSGKNVMNVFRAHFGIGIPFGSSKAMPFEKSFYIGGANSLRAWTIGTLGPGAYQSNSTSFEMTGDIKIEFNYELRFNLSQNLEGVFFGDMGNIWLLNKSDAMPNANIKFPDMFEQFAIDFGYGLRYDLEFLIIRFDIAHPIYQPYLPLDSRWSALNTKGKLITGFNFALGYPF